MSPDGRLIAYFSIGERQEDIFVGPPGGPIRRITDDAPRDRGPVFSADGRSIVFYSSREGQWGLWMVGIDGGGLRKVIMPSGGAVYPVASPKGDRVAYIGDDGRSAFTIPFAPGKTVEPTALEGAVVDGRYFTPMDWSQSATRLAGFVVADSGRPAGVAVYDVATRKTTLVSTDQAYAVSWLDGERLVIYFTRGGQDLVVVDTATGKRTRLDVRLPAPSIDDIFAVAPGGRTIYYGAARAEADIWIVERPPAGSRAH